MLAGQKRKRSPHPYLSGNFAPINSTVPLTPCAYTGAIPPELAGGQYVRNGANPLANSDLGRDAHWFDGDGMLSGVLFRRSSQPDGDKGEFIQPEFINQYIHTDLYRSSVETQAEARKPILPSISTLIDPAATLLKIAVDVCRAGYIVFLTHLHNSKQAIRRISVANTGVFYHDGRALATCESGPPMRIRLPELETVGWYNDGVAEGEPGICEGSTQDRGILSFMNEWTTGHPKVDPVTNELLLFHSTFLSPYVRYSVSSPAGESYSEKAFPILKKVAVPGVSGPRMMHDFGVSSHHTVIMDLPLSLNPLNVTRGKPVVDYEPDGLSRFGVFPRHNPAAVRWFQTAACCIFHTANTWDEYDDAGNVIAVNLLACRLNSAAMVYRAGHITAPGVRRGRSLCSPGRRSSAARSPEHWLESGLEKPIPEGDFSSLVDDVFYDEDDGRDEDEQCLLHHYRFSLLPSSSNTITHSRPLIALPFEFPTLRPSCSGRFARYIYGCSTRVSPAHPASTSFGTALGRAAKIDLLVKADVASLLSRGNQSFDMTDCSSSSAVDTRSAEEILASQLSEDKEVEGGRHASAVQCFAMPPGWYAQEAFFVPSSSSSDEETEDAGHLLFYAFDESQLPPACLHGTAPPPLSAYSELWILNARDMQTIVARVKLPQRVPYGLHGRWFEEKEVLGQRAVHSVRKVLPEHGTKRWQAVQAAIAEDAEAKRKLESFLLWLFLILWAALLVQVGIWCYF